jgi:S-adenosylmethionine/arginine decarboxylase-like enzyme
MKKYLTKGKHVLLDLQYNPTSINISPKDLMDIIFNIIGKSILTLSKMTIVDARKYELAIPPGFTIFYCLDESHCSCHSYTDTGLLSLDCYTCGPTDPAFIMENIQKEITKIIPSIEVTYINIVHRFNYQE